MIIGDLGDTSGPVTTDELRWLREWMSPRSREDDSGSDDEPEGLIDSSSEKEFGNANPEDGVDPPDFKDDEQSVTEIAREGLHQSLQQMPDSDFAESESSNSDGSHDEVETNRDPGDEDGFYGISDVVIPSTSTDEFVEASGRLSDALHENIQIQGPLSKRQTKRLGRFLDNIRSEFIQAWLRGEDVEVWFRGLEARLEYNPAEDGLSCICRLGKPFKKGDDTEGEGKWIKVRNGITLDSGCSVFVIPSDWLKWFVLEASEGSKRGQKFIAATGQGIKNEGQRTVKLSTDDGKRRRMTFQVAQVNKILASVAGIYDNGNEFTFTATGGRIVSIRNGRITKFRRHGNVYVMDIWVLNPDYKNPDDKTQGFIRQGQTR